jgi:hypothetical protein
MPWSYRKCQDHLTSRKGHHDKAEAPMLLARDDHHKAGGKDEGLLVQKDKT